MALPKSAKKRPLRCPPLGKTDGSASKIKDQTARFPMCWEGDVAAARIDESCIAHAEGHWDGEGDGGVVGDDVVGQVALNPLTAREPMGV